jgi:resolvase-like protein
MPRSDPSRKRCAIYTRKSSEEGLEQEFNSLQAQCEACEAYIRSQRHEGWILARTRYDDGGFSGGNIERPALQRLLAETTPFPPCFQRVRKPSCVEAPQHGSPAKALEHVDTGTRAAGKSGNISTRWVRSASVITIVS